MEEVDKRCLMIRMGVSRWMFLLVLAYLVLVSLRQRAIKRLFVCVCLSSLLLPHYFVIKIKRKQQIPRQILEAKANTRNTFGNCIWACLDLPFVNILHHEAEQEAQLSPRDHAMRRVNWNLANCHATVQKLLIRQVLTKSMVWSWRFSRRQCVIDNVQCTQPWRDRVGSHCLRCHKQTDGRVVYITCIPTTCCGEIF